MRVLFSKLEKKVDNNREIWVDDVKVFACMLVLLGHLMQSMTSAGIVPSNNLYAWFNKTIYYFHVPLFFVCSGYLYQNFSVVNSFESWSKNILKKLIALGIPYFSFTIVTWMIKEMFSGAGNNEIDNLFNTLFFQPTSPYWYLYALFLVFLITPTFSKNKNALIGCGVAVAMKIIWVIWGGTFPYAISIVISNEIWFVFGMSLCVLEVKNIQFNKTFVGIGLGSVFLALSILLRNLDNVILSFVLGLMACVAVVLFFMDRNKQGKVLTFFSQYTMPIFLMHSIFAATLRSVLLKIGISNTVVHITFGIAISIFGPVIAAWVMNKTKYLEFFIYPGKFIKIETLKRS